jgi:hypothetical protein
MAAYRTGRTLNELRWHLEQFFFFPEEAIPNQDVESWLLKLIPLVREVLEVLKSVQVERQIFSEVANWNAMLRSDAEQLGEHTGETCEHYLWRARGGHFDEYFNDVTALGRDTAARIQTALLDALADQEPLQLAFQLGLMVDQGIRPEDSMQFVFIQVDEDAEAWSYLSLPKACMVDRFCSRAVTPNALLWPLKIRELWHHLQIAVELPKAILDFHKQPATVDEVAQITELLDEAAERGFDRRESLNQGAATCSIPTEDGLSGSALVLPDYVLASGITRATPSNSTSSAQSPSHPASSSPEHPEVPVITGHERKKRVQSKQPRVSNAETDKRVGDYLKDHPDATLAEVARDTGLPKSSISNTQSLKTHDKPLKLEKAKGPRTRNLRSDRALEPASVEYDPARRSVDRESLEVLIGNYATADEKNAYFAPMSNRDAIAEKLLRRVKGEVDEYLSTQGTEYEKKEYEQMVNQGDYGWVCWFAGEIREKDARRLDRQIIL